MSHRSENSCPASCAADAELLLLRLLLALGFRGREICTGASAALPHPHPPLQPSRPWCGQLEVYILEGPDPHAMKMPSSLWARFYSNSCCLCCHVRTGTIILGIWYLLINAVVLLIILSALTDPSQYHLTTAELGSDFEFMDDANMCIATAISLLMILICAMATYGAYKQHAAWIIPFFCYQIFDFALNTLVAISILVYPSTIQDYVRQLPANFPYKEEIVAVNSTCLVVVILLLISITLGFKAYLICCVWNCYRYINNRNNSDVLVYITTNDTAVLLPPYEDPANGNSKDPPPPYVSA